MSDATAFLMLDGVEEMQRVAKLELQVALVREHRTKARLAVEVNNMVALEKFVGKR